MNLAPVLCGKPGATHSTCQSGVNPKLHAAYAAWAEHHAVCGHCGLHDWYNPGLPLLNVSEDLAEGHIIVKRDGKKLKVTYRATADPDVLCDDGRRLFKTWRRQAGGFTAAGLPDLGEDE